MKFHTESTRWGNLRLPGSIEPLNTLTIIYTTLFTLTETCIVLFEKIKRGSSFRMKKLAPGSDFPKTKIMP